MVIPLFNFRSRDYSGYTEGALVNALTLALSSIYECELYEDPDSGEVGLYLFHPYLDQAEGLIYKIKVYNPVPKYVIWGKDIPTALSGALLKLGKVAMKRVITEAVGGIYESIDSDYYHTNGLHGMICWGFGKSKK